jgi:DNA repair ATPase RecN
MCALVNDSKKLENLIIKVFSQKFKRRRDLGKEYFEGNIDRMAIEFTKKSNYLTHVNKKISCSQKEHAEYKILKRTCSYCNEIFASPFSMKTHMNICKKKPNEIEELRQIIINLNNKLSKKYDQLYVELNEKNSKLETEIKEMKENNAKKPKKKN